MHSTPQANRLHIALFGRRNAGKSSLINALTNQEIALVSEVPGTTTDPVFKAMELLPLGPVVLIDTAGLDDDGPLGELRVQRTRRILSSADLAVLVIDAETGVGPYEQQLVFRIRQEGLPMVAFVNKADLQPLGSDLMAWETLLGIPVLVGSALTGQGIDALKVRLGELASREIPEPPLLAGMLRPGQTVVMVVPIDAAAPKGRLILPQVQALREILDADARAVVVREHGLAAALEGLRELPDLVITDSQAFGPVAAVLSPKVPLTSFSILFARQKGELGTLVAGARALDALRAGDRVLVSEACTHDRKCGDIGTQQIPHRLQAHVGGELQFTWTSGTGFPDHPAGYKLAIHCGGCMIHRREMLRRLEALRVAGVPVVNYGVLLAKLSGILDRALAPIPSEDLLAGGALR